MGTVAITATTAQDRHPEAYIEIVALMRKKGGKTPLPEDPFDWSWSYQTAERISGAARRLSPPPKGRDLLAHKVQDLFISLQASAARRSQSVAFDNTALLAGPDSQLPLEVLGVTVKPAGLPVWVWSKPGHDEPPAWREHILTGAAQTSVGWILRVRAQDDSEEDILIDPTTKVGRQLASWPDQLKSKEIKQIDKVLRTQMPEPLVAVLPLSLVTSTFQGSSGAVEINARSASISELLGALQGPGFMSFGTPPPDEAAPVPGVGPWIDWDGQTTAQHPSSTASSPKPRRP